VKHKINNLLTIKSLTSKEINNYLSKQKAIKKYYSEGNLIKINCLLYESDSLKYAILIKKKVGKATIRNYIKRKIREILINHIKLRLMNIQKQETNYAIIFIVKEKM